MAAGGLFAFARTPMPAEAQGPFRSGALTLKVFCWVALIGTLLSASLLVLMGLAILFFAALFGSLFESFLGDLVPFGGAFLGGAIGAIAFIVLIVIAVVTLAVGLLVVWWAGWIYQRWLERDARALTHALVLGIILASLGGLNLLATGGAAVLDPGTVAMLVFGVLFIVFATRQDVKAVFAPIPAAPPMAP